MEIPATNRVSRMLDDLDHPISDGILLALVAVGTSLVVAGIFLPWLTIYHGLTILSGLDGDGIFLAGLGVGAALLWTLYLHLQRPVALQRLSLVAAGGLISYAAFEAWRIWRYAADPGPAAALTSPVPGPGPMVMALGALLLFAAIWRTRPLRHAVPTGLWPALFLSVVLFTVGWVHLTLTREHLEESTLLGLGFFAAAIAQIGLAGVVTLRPSQVAYLLIVAVNSSLMFLFAYNALVGLPFGTPDHHGSGILIGAGEPITIPGAMTQILEFTGIVVAFLRLDSNKGTALAADPT